MESATFLTPPRKMTGTKSGILLSVITQYFYLSEGPEYEKMSTLYRCKGDDLYQLYTDTATAITSLSLSYHMLALICSCSLCCIPETGQATQRQCQCVAPLVLYFTNIQYYAQSV